MPTKPQSPGLGKAADPELMAQVVEGAEGIDDKRRAELDLQADREVQVELRQAEEKEYLRLQKIAKLEAKLKAKRGKTIQGEAVETVTVDLPSYMNYIALDGRTFYHGQTKTVRVSVAAVLNEQMQRAWDHEREVKGDKNPNAYRRKLNQRVSLADAGAAA